jgi:hypothetical protein
MIYIYIYIRQKKIQSREKKNEDGIKKKKELFDIVIKLNRAGQP